MDCSVLVSGGEGPERYEYTKKVIDELISTDGKKEIIIYDATYRLVGYINQNDIFYYCVDSVVAYVEKLKQMIALKQVDNSYTTYILTDAYGGFMFSKENRSLYLDILQNQQKYNIKVLMSTRHISFVPEEFIPYFKETIQQDEIYTRLSNTNK